MAPNYLLALNILYAANAVRRDSGTDEADMQVRATETMNGTAMAHDKSLFFKEGGVKEGFAHAVGHNSTCVYNWRQCGGKVGGGKPWSAPTTCCDSSQTCVWRSDWWSGCEIEYTPNSGEPYNKDCAPPLGQCGGPAWYHGPKCCQAGQKCVQLNPYVSLCE
eukprot:TRINITY_DN6185_c0_g1_i3.p1 TRINITY_DN6185_c0_g1~~TRINITY_DN6185_c0_g1_i3.p1  ORF type:complete len:185 (+),score=17.73 TRINITY_DN6185_c0_g1_i3:71-556(+)